MTIYETLLSRWNPKHDDDPKMEPVKRAMQMVIEVPAKLHAQQEALSRNPNLSAVGRYEEIRKSFSTSDVGGRLQLARKTVETMRAKQDERRANLLPRSPDKTDAAGAAMRVELRAMLRSMGNGKRIQLLLSSDADSRFQDAALEAPDAASGITAEIRERLTDAVTERLFPGEAAKLEEIDEAIGLVDATYKVVMTDVSRFAGLPDNNRNVIESAVTDALGPEKVGNIDAVVSQDFAGFADD
ncbi:MAG: hypothetical protein KDK91_32770 [Gammaproteobacteria bacterium]|nr:hypothetical protein [Gammaproteobacteria bacterium]